MSADDQRVEGVDGWVKGELFGAAVCAFGGVVNRADTHKTLVPVPCPDLCHLEFTNLVKLLKLNFHEKLTQKLVCCSCCHSHLFFKVVWLTTRRLPVSSQSRRTDIFLITALTHVWSIIGMESLMKL
jgi:hypothetical protein